LNHDLHLHQNIIWPLQSLYRTPHHKNCLQVSEEMFSKFFASPSNGSVGWKFSFSKVVLTYVLFISSAFWVWRHVANGEQSSALTLSVIAQCLALALLALQISLTGSAKGISAVSLTLETASIACRLSGVTWLNGYLPVDASGDWIFQAVDFGSLFLALWLLYQVKVAKLHTYEEEGDTFAMGPVALGCLIIAMLFHADNHDRPVFDCLWMMGLLMSVAAVVPQYGLIINTSGKVEALISHSIAAMGVSRMMSGYFMWNARGHISCRFWIQDFNHAIALILLAHAVHLFLLSDFAFYYVKSMFSRGVTSQLELPLSQTISF